MNEAKRISRKSEGPDTAWQDVPLSALIDHLLVAYHRPLDEQMPRITMLAAKVLDAHGAQAPQDLAGIQSTFAELRDELEHHMMKEERVLFPLIRDGRGTSTSGPVQVMLHEHDDAITALERLRLLTDNYTAPKDACTTWRSLWSELSEFESELLEHIRLENEILFPRALAGDQG